MTPGLVIPEGSIREFSLMRVFATFSVFYMGNSMESSEVKAMRSAWDMP